jgi:hypothetical protein
MVSFLVSYKGASGLSSVRVSEGSQYRPRLAQRERFATRRVLVFALELAAGGVACVGAILAIFAWTGISL